MAIVYHTGHSSFSGIESPKPTEKVHIFSLVIDGLVSYKSFQYFRKVRRDELIATVLQRLGQAS